MTCSCLQARRPWRRAFLLSLVVALLLPLLLATLTYTTSAAEPPPPDGDVGNVMLINPREPELLETGKAFPAIPTVSLRNVTSETVPS